MLTLLAMGGCATTGAPEDWLSPAAQAPGDPYGAWVTVEFVKPHEDDSLLGEFIAVDGDSLYVLNPYCPPGDPVRAVPLGTVKKARIAHFDPETGKAIGWVTAGSISTLSHGLGAVITLPLWIIVGSAVAGGHSRTPLENYPDLSWDELKMYARFPQGPPPNLHGLGLRPKIQGAKAPPPKGSEKNFEF
jgi:hypothetical protein